MRDSNQVQEFLNANIKRSEISSREGFSGRVLLFLESWQVIKKLNDAFGNMGWDNETMEMEQVPGSKFPTYKAKTRISATVRVGENALFSIKHDGYGFGVGKNVDDHELAIKAAESDSFKRAAMKFGPNLGLALYDKSEEFITDDRPNQSTTAAQESPRSVTQGTQAPRVSPVSPVSAVRPATQANAGQATPVSPREALNNTIRATASVAFSKKVDFNGVPFDLPAMKGILAGYGVEQTDQLTDPQAHEVLERLKFLIQ